MRPPKFSDDEAVAKLVGKIIEDENLADEAYWAAEDFDHPPLRVVVTPASIEGWAIEKAKRGNFKPLADMLENGKLGQGALALIASKLRGTFKAKKGRLKRTFLELELDPKLEAAKEVERIVVILRGLYEKQKGIRERAITIAADRAGIDREKLENYVLRSRHYYRRRKRPT